jgi:haloalkane dehalogenase
MTVLRTPDSAFDGIEGYPFAPHYLDIADAALGALRIHYVDEGGRDGAPVLMMHGEPSWSYLYRKMIPIVTEAGFRAIAPDLVGFGKSDKPADRAAFSYNGHVDWMLQWFDALGLTGVTLFCQDWGGLIGLRLVAARPEKFARVVVSNSFLPTGEATPSEAFLRWREFSQSVPEFPTGGILQGGTARGISDAARAAYDAPYPDESYKAAARMFPTLVPASADDPGGVANREAWKVLERFDKPVLTLFGDSDPVTAGADRALQARIPGTRGQPHRTIAKCGHFSQEDAGEELAEALVDFIRATA